MTTGYLPSHDGYVFAEESTEVNGRRHRLLKKWVIVGMLIVVACAGFLAMSARKPIGKSVQSHAPVMDVEAWTNEEARIRKGDYQAQEIAWDDMDYAAAHSGTGDDPSIVLKPWPEKLDDGADLVVSWTIASGKLHAKDYLGLSCGVQSRPDDYLMRVDAKEHDATPNSVRFPELYMLRCNYTVAYVHYRKESKSFKPIAKLTVGMRESFNVPKHGHLALATKEDAMTIMFNSASSRTPYARYGTDQNQLKDLVSGTTTTYSAADMCQEPATKTAQKAFRDPGFMHTVIMTDLIPDTYYYYQYGNPTDGWSPVRQFRSRPSKDKKEAKFIAYGDLGVDPAPAGQGMAARVFGDIAGNGFDSFLLHFGDVSYARSEAWIWDKFFRMIEPFATRIPYMIGVGNHEYGYTSGGEHDPSGEAGPTGHGFHPDWGNYGADSFGECGVPMVHRWHVPAGGNSVFWYSFNYGGIHVVQMSSEHDWTRGSKQYNWIKNDLEHVDRQETPWIILTAHRMMYSTQLGMDSDIRVAQHFRGEMDDLLMKNRVNLVLVGHQHAYERSCPVYKGQCQDAAPVHIVAGMAGFELDTTEFSTKYGDWSMSHVNEYGYLRIESTAERMHVQFVKTRDGAVYDDVTLYPY